MFGGILFEDENLQNILVFIVVLVLGVRLNYFIVNGLFYDFYFFFVVFNLKIVKVVLQISGGQLKKDLVYIQFLQMLFIEEV